MEVDDVRQSLQVQLVHSLSRQLFTVSLHQNTHCCTWSVSIICHLLRTHIAGANHLIHHPQNRLPLLACRTVTPSHQRYPVHGTHNRQDAEDMEHEAAAAEERGSRRPDKEEEGDRSATACAEGLVASKSNHTKRNCTDTHIRSLGTLAARHDEDDLPQPRRHP